MKVIHLISGGDTGGAKTHVHSLLQNLSRSVTETEELEDGSVEETTVTGVYCVSGREAEFKPVNVLYQGEDYYLVEPVDPASATRLRADDEIILNSKGLYDGKVIR